jgi:non-heme chloroperoxidase
MSKIEPIKDRPLRSVQMSYHAESDAAPTSHALFIIPTRCGVPRGLSIVRYATTSDGAGVSADSSGLRPRDPCSRPNPIPNPPTHGARADDRRAEPAAKPTEEDEMSMTASPKPITQQAVEGTRSTTASISEREYREIEAANASGNTPVVFIHGLWLLPSSWAKWADFFKQAGYAPLTPDWPADPETVEGARAEPEVVAKKTLKQVADHTTEIIKALNNKPVVMGHSTGGLLAQMLAGRGLSAATVAIDPGVFRGVLPLPASVLKGVGPFLANPLTRGRAVTLTFEQFKYGWANALDEKEAKQLYDTYHVAGSGIALVQMGNANLNPWTEAKVDTKNPDRGPLLIIDGEKDHTVPWAIANAAYKRQRRNPGVTEIVKMPNRGHSLTIDHGWREVAQTALDFVKRFA